MRWNNIIWLYVNSWGGLFLQSAPFLYFEDFFITSSLILIFRHINLQDFNVMETGSTIAHDVKIASYVTIYLGVNIAGNVKIANECELGANSCIIQGLNVGEKTIIDTGAVVIRDIDGKCTVVGNPARVIKRV